MSSQIIRNAIQATIPLANDFLNQHEGNVCELESRLGKIDVNGNFISGVSKEFFVHWLNEMKSYEGWHMTNDWEESMDVIWSNDVRGTKKIDQTEFKMTFQEKKRLRNLTFKCPEREYDVRVSLKTEKVVTEMPNFHHRLVRFKRRKEFNHKNIIMYCFTIVSEGKEKQTAIKNNNKRFEIEFELLNTRNCKNFDSNYLSASMLEKTVDFLGRSTPFSLNLIH